jgi:hypothetical protein
LWALRALIPYSIGTGHARNLDNSVEMVDKVKEGGKIENSRRAFLHEEPTVGVVHCVADS